MQIKTIVVKLYDIIIIFIKKKKGKNNSYNISNCICQKYQKHPVQGVLMARRYDRVETLETQVINQPALLLDT